MTRDSIECALGSEFSSDSADHGRGGCISDSISLIARPTEVMPQTVLPSGASNQPSVPSTKAHDLFGSMRLAFISLLSLGLPSMLRAQTIDQLVPHRVKLESVTYLGKPAVRVIEDGEVPNGEAYAIVRGDAFHNGEIDVELAGRPVSAGSTGARGFIGIAFRLHNDQFEYIYLRPTNGRAEDQVRRNHSTQYSAYPSFDFATSRRDAPEKYESYVDLEPGVWTRFRLTVNGATARLYVHGASQPCLIVNDLKLGDSSGPVALWIGPGTEGYFAALKVAREK